MIHGGWENIPSSESLIFQRCQGNAFHSFPCCLPDRVGHTQEKLHTHAMYPQISAPAAHELVHISHNSLSTVPTFYGPSYPHFHKTRWAGWPIYPSLETLWPLKNSQCIFTIRGHESHWYRLPQPLSATYFW